MRGWAQSPWVLPVALVVLGWLLLVVPEFRFLLVLLVIGGVFAAIALAPNVRRRTALEILARETGGKLVEEPFWGDDIASTLGIDPTSWRYWPKVTGPLRDTRVEYSDGGTRVRLEVRRPATTAQSNRRESWCTEILARTRGRDERYFELYRRGTRPRTPAFTMREVDHGIDEILGSYVAVARSPEQVQRLLTPRLVQAILSAMPSRLGVSEIDGASHVWLEDEGPLISPLRFGVLYPLFVELFDAVHNVDRERAGSRAETPTAPAARGEDRPSEHPVAPAPEPAPAPTPEPPTPEPPTPALPTPALPTEPTIAAASPAEPGTVGPGPVEPAAGQPADIGTTLRNDHWEITLAGFGPYETLAGTSPGATSARTVVAEFRITNLQRYTGTLTTSGVTLEDSQGRSITASGQTASIDKGFWLTWLQSGQTAEHRAVFELDPDAQPVAVTIMGLRFALAR